MAMSTATVEKPLVVTSEKSSLKFIQKVVLSSIAQIFRARRFFSDDEAFEFRNFGFGMVVETFKKLEDLGGEAREVVSLLIDAMDAVDKKYLHKLILSFYVDEPNNPLESYSFIFGHDFTDEEFSISIDDFRKLPSNLTRASKADAALQSSTLSAFKTLRKTLETRFKGIDLPPGVNWTYTLKYYPYTPQSYSIPNGGFCQVLETIPNTFFDLGVETQTNVMNTTWTQMGLKIKSKYANTKTQKNTTLITGELDFSYNI